MRSHALVLALILGTLPLLGAVAPSEGPVSPGAVRVAAVEAVNETPNPAAMVAPARVNLQRTHRLGPDPGMAALRLFLGVGARLDTVARAAAEAAYASNNIHSAVPLLYATHVLAPEDTLSLRRLGFAAKTSGHYELAYDALRHATLRSPGEFEVWWWLADTERLLGFYNDALEHMRHALQLAPPAQAKDLADYVAYSEYLADPTPSWESFDIHRDFAARHQETRRMRRTAAEYQEALALLPEFDADDTEAWARIAWAAMETGYQYAYLQEHETAIYFFERAARLYERTGVPVDTGRCLNNAADSYAVLAATQPARRGELLDRVIERRDQALALNRHARDPVQSRYTMGRLLENLVNRHGAEHPRVTELRKLALGELPWTGAIEEFSMVAIAEGEIACRVSEGDLGGARQLLERIRSYLVASQYLEDTIRLAKHETTLAHIQQQQGHAGAAIQSGQDALAVVAQVRGYLHAEAFMRSEAAISLRHSHAAIVRGAISAGDFTMALASAEEYRAAHLTTLLGGAAAGEAHFADLGLEATLAAARLKVIAAERAEAEAAGDQDALARLAEDEAREQALVRRLESRPETSDSMPVHQLGITPVLPDELRTAVPEDALYIAYIVDPWGACALTVGSEGIGGVLLDEADEHTLFETVTAFQRAVRGGGEATPALETLASAILTPLAATFGERRLIFAPDYVLYSVPFAALPLDGAYLVERHDVAHITSGAHLVRAHTAPQRAGDSVILCRAEDGGGESMLFDEAAAVAYVEAPIDVWTGEATLTALLLAPGEGFDGRLHVAEIAARTLPPAAALCLGDGWPPSGTGQEPVQTLTHALMLAGADSAVFNLWRTACAPVQALAEAGFDGGRALNGQQRAQISAGAPLAEWAALVVYGPRP
jgi:tetratricopeptide (TPR) repeat protein